MSEANPILEGDDFVQGASIARIAPNGMLLEHARGEPVILALARHGDELFAVGATCTHYGAPLVDGLIVVAVVHRDLEGLRAEVEFERAMAIGHAGAKASS